METAEENDRQAQTLFIVRFVSIYFNITQNIANVWIKAFLNTDGGIICLIKNQAYKTLKDNWNSPLSFADILKQLHFFKSSQSLRRRTVILSFTAKPLEKSCPCSLFFLLCVEICHYEETKS